MSSQTITEGKSGKVVAVVGEGRKPLTIKDSNTGEEIPLTQRGTLHKPGVCGASVATPGEYLPTAFDVEADIDLTPESAANLLDLEAIQSATIIEEDDVVTITTPTGTKAQLTKEEYEALDKTKQLGNFIRTMETQKQHQQMRDDQLIAQFTYQLLSKHKGHSLQVEYQGQPDGSTTLGLFCKTCRDRLLAVNSGRSNTVTEDKPKIKE